jgi:hypothetical protein
MKKRTKQLMAQWTTAARRLEQKLGGVQRDQKQVRHPLGQCSPQGLGNVLGAHSFHVGMEKALIQVALNVLKFDLGAGWGWQGQDGCRWGPGSL